MLGLPQDRRFRQQRASVALDGFLVARKKVHQDTRCKERATVASVIVVGGYVQPFANFVGRAGRCRRRCVRMHSFRSMSRRYKKKSVNERIPQAGVVESDCRYHSPQHDTLGGRDSW